jgi:hypothetical protein
MPITLDEFREKIKAIVRAHYERTRAPLLLSHLGAEIERRQLWPEERGQRNLKQLISETCEPELQIVRDKRSPAYIAVVTPDVRAEVEDQIAKRTPVQQSIQIRLEDLARPILLAFCIDVQNQPVYVRRVPPFRYEVGAIPQDRISEHILVDAEYRRPGLRLDHPQQLPSADKHDLENRIQKWAMAHGVDLKQFMRTEEPAGSQPEDGHTALDRLLAAQPRDIAERMLIPADIAQILTRIR